MYTHSHASHPGKPFPDIQASCEIHFYHTDQAQSLLPPPPFFPTGHSTASHAIVWETRSNDAHVTLSAQRGLLGWSLGEGEGTRLGAQVNLFFSLHDLD